MVETAAMKKPDGFTYIRYYHTIKRIKHNSCIHTKLNGNSNLQLFMKQELC